MTNIGATWSCSSIDRSVFAAFFDADASAFLTMCQDLDRDRILKLQKFREGNPGVEGFLCVFGVKSVFEALVVPNSLRKRRDPVYAALRNTRFGVEWSRSWRDSRARGSLV